MEEHARLTQISSRMAKSCVSQIASPLWSQAGLVRATMGPMEWGMVAQTGLGPGRLGLPAQIPHGPRSGLLSGIPHKGRILCYNAWHRQISSHIQSWRRQVCLLQVPHLFIWHFTWFQDSRYKYRWRSIYQGVMITFWNRSRTCNRYT